MKALSYSSKLLSPFSSTRANPVLLHSLFSTQSWQSAQHSPRFEQPQRDRQPIHIPVPEPELPNPCLNASNYSELEFSTLIDLLQNTDLSVDSALQRALDRTGIEPTSSLLEAVFEHFDSSPKLLHKLFLWAEKQSGFGMSATLFSYMIKMLAKAREFDSAWLLILDQLDGKEGESLVSQSTFAMMIRRYARAGMVRPAVRTLEFVGNLNSMHCDCKTNLFEILLDSFCKEGHVREASEYLDRKMVMDPTWVPSIRVYNILLNGWFRSRKLKNAERLWAEMKKNNVKPSFVTYGTLVEGYCRMRRVERAIELVSEMKEEGIEPNAIVYNPIIDALGEEGRFKEALGMMERFFVLELGPNISTYNSLVKGFCKAGDLKGASKILKMMVSRRVSPTPTTYNYFFRHFSKLWKIEEGMNLYNKMVASGYNPDRLTYHLLLKMLCEDGRLELAVQVSKEMRSRGFDMDLDTSTMFIHLLCNMYRLEEACAEFEYMIRKGIIPQHLTFQKLNAELKKGGMTTLSQKLCHLMDSVPHSMRLPDSYRGDRDDSRARRTAIIQKAEVMSDILRTCNDPRELVKHRNPLENAVSTASRLIEDIKRRATET